MRSKACLLFAFVAVFTSCSDAAVDPRETGPVVTCVSILDAPDTVKPDHVKAFAPACALARAGFREEAAEELKDAIRENPTEVVPSDLRDLQPRRLGPWPSLRQNWGRWLIDLGEVVAVVVLLLFGVFVVLRLLFRATLGRIRWVRKVLRHSRPVVLAPLDKNGGNDVEGAMIAMAVRIREELRNLDSEAGGRSIAFVDAPAEDLGVPTLSQTAPQMKYVDAALALLQRIAPRDIVELAIVLHPASKDGAGITVTLTGHTGRLIATATLWEKTYDPEMVVPNPVISKPVDGTNGSSNLAGERSAADVTGRYGSLAAPAAVWILYGLREEKDSPPLGTRRWESYALFKAGTGWLDAGDNRRARVLFHRAMSDDHGNIGARVNLARIAFEEEASASAVVREEQGQARQMTELACGQIVENAADRYRELQFLRAPFPKEQSFRWDPLWYRPAFNLAVLHAHRYCLAESAARRVEDLEVAISMASELVRAIEATLVELDSPPRSARLWRPKRSARRKEDAALRHLLERLEPSAVIVLASMLAPKTLCFDFTEGDKAPGCDARETLLVDVEKGTSHGRLIKFLGPLRGLDGNGYYNIACYCSFLGSIAEEKGHPDPVDGLQCAALDFLRIALDGGGLEVDALSDPSLRSLRCGHRARDFVTLVDRAVARERGCTIRDELDLVDEESAKKLVAEGITSKWRLVQAAATLADRQALEKAVGIKEPLIWRWANLADLLDQIESNEPMEIVPKGFATLLHNAGVGSLHAFKNCDESDRQLLAQRLATVNRRCNAVDWEPHCTTLDSWWKKLHEADATSRVS